MHSYPDLLWHIFGLSQVNLWTMSTALIEKCDCASYQFKAAQNVGYIINSKWRQRSLLLSLILCVWKNTFWYSIVFCLILFSCSIGGFDVTRFLGKEDLHLYRKYLHSNLMVVRAPSRELFQMWHATPCAENLPTESFNECIQTRAMNEASHSQMGKLFFTKK